PQTTRAFAGAQRSRKSHLRRADSSSTTSRSGNASASGMPGTPPPEPTSTIGPSFSRTSSSARRESSSRTARAASSGSAVRPGASTTARSQASRNEDDDVAIGLVPLAGRLDAVIVLEPFVDEPPLAGAHRLERDSLTGAQRLLGAVYGKGFDRAAAALPVAGGVDDDLLARVLVLAQDRARERLHRVDRLAVAADQQPEVAAGAGR